MDKLTPTQRSYLMSRIRSKNTKPELEVRRLLHRLGFRFRVHDRSLPGQPDLVFPQARKVIFVDGCFWHGHDCRPNRVWPQGEYWSAKLARNIDRDFRNLQALKGAGWGVLRLWECEIPAGEWVPRVMVFLASSPEKVKKKSERL